MPLTEFQQSLLAVLAINHSDASYLAGAAALHFSPNSLRYSDDLDFFHDTVERVASAFAADRQTLASSGFSLTVELSQPGFVRAIVTRGNDATRVDWAHDSAWRFMPLVRDPFGGLLLHPVDVAVNKILALAGRDEPRDFVDVLYIHEKVLPIGALVWAAVGKDPGFTPLSLLELLKRRGRYQVEDFARLALTTPFDLVASKEVWMAALATAETFVRSRPPDEVGCLYYSTTTESFVIPSGPDGTVFPHYGLPGGVLPRIMEQ